MKLYVIWYRDFASQSEVIDSIWTNPTQAISRKKTMDANKDFNKYNDYDTHSNTIISEVEADTKAYNLDLDIRLRSHI